MNKTLTKEQIVAAHSTASKLYMTNLSSILYYLKKLSQREIDLYLRQNPCVLRQVREL